MASEQSFSNLHEGATQRFKDVGIDQSALDARLLLEAAAGISHASFIACANDLVKNDVAGQFESFVQRRLKKEPVYRILGRREFHGLDLKLSTDTLEPRDDSECLIEGVLEQLSSIAGNGFRKKPWLFADLGTGTGSLALALLQELPEASAFITDLSAGALSTATDNAKLNQLHGRVTALQGSWCEPFGEVHKGSFDFIISNPPYIASDVVDGLSAEVLNYDPRLALDGGVDGLVAYRDIFSSVVPFLKPDGYLALEIGFDQDVDVSKLGVELGWKKIRKIRDLNHQDRVLIFAR